MGVVVVMVVLVLVMMMEESDFVLSGSGNLWYFYAWCISAVVSSERATRSNEDSSEALARCMEHVGRAWWYRRPLDSHPKAG